MVVVSPWRYLRLVVADDLHGVENVFIDQWLKVAWTIEVEAFQDDPPFVDWVAQQVIE